MSPSADTATAFLIRLCYPNEAPVLLDAMPGALPEDGVGVVWVDVRAGTDPSSVLTALEHLAPTLVLGDIEDLMERDELAKTHDRAVGFRNASFVGFDTRAGSDQAAPDLLVQMTETLVGEKLLVSCWHPSRLFHGAAGAADDDLPVLRDAVMADVMRSWTVDECETPSDIASALVQALLLRSRPMVFELEHALQTWELAYHTHPTETETQPLKHLLAMVNEVRRRLVAFENARPVGVSGPHRFTASVAPSLEERVDALTAAALRRCGVLLEGIRASMELVSMDKIARQAETAEMRARGEAAFQGRLEKVTALLLVPTLIAGIFGANTALPGGGTWVGFDTMLVLMVVTSLAVYVFLMARRGVRQAGSRGAG